MKVNDQWCNDFIPFRSTTAEKRKLVAKNNKVQSSYQHNEKTRARGNTRDERISNDNGGRRGGPHEFHKS